MGALKCDQTNNSPDYTTDRRRPWNKYQLNHSLEFTSSFYTH